MALAHRSTLRALLAMGLCGVLALSLMAGVDASSHREAPLITEDPVADNTDVYAFVSPDRPDTVTLISNWIPLENPAGGPNFYNFGEDVLYEINIDNDGDAVDDVTYEFRFRTQVVDASTFLYATGPVTYNADERRYDNLNIAQFYSVAVVRDGRRRELLGRHLPVTPNNVGPRSTPDYDALAEAGVHTLRNGVKVFAGQRDEAFPVDLGSIFDLGALRPLQPQHILPPNEAAPGINSTAGFNVHSIALQVPIEHLVQNADQPVIGMYSTTYRRQVRLYRGGDGANLRHRGPFVQISRLGNPLINEVLIPLRLKDEFNASPPRVDQRKFAFVIRRTRLDNALAALYGPSGAFTCFPDVDGKRQDLVAILLRGIPGLNEIGKDPRLAEYLRLNTAVTPSSDDPNDNDPRGLLGGELDGFPNGRRLNDDVTDIALRAVAGATPLGVCDGVAPNDRLGDGVEGNDMPYLQQFPYIPHPHSGYDDPNGAQADEIILRPNA